MLNLLTSGEAMAAQQHFINVDGPSRTSAKASLYRCCMDTRKTIAAGAIGFRDWHGIIA
ncbi:hypothetical protein [Alloalcanivorax xenomutans]|uniref:hypothetical protein n=1 Tax=Alloalcanivorax xenomutans TaxID=1094342 RepID=UPI0013141A85|nr:hypothetical protein [Alloalcanivorax xenomutans]